MARQRRFRSNKSKTNHSTGRSCRSRSPQPPPITELDVRNAKAPPRFEVKAPAGAPNVLIVLIDDMGFGQSSAFGGPIHMPTVERLASNGLRYNQFHTTALCSPTRAALLSGRNHHVCNMGSITETATAFPGQTGQRPNSVAPLAEMLRLNGFATAAFGKSHETAAWEVSTSGPTNRWPTRSGFDKFYGFIGGEANQWAPAIYDGMNQIEPPKEPNYHFLTDMTDQAIDWAKAVKSLTPDKPFFIYFAPGATHAPHHVPKEWIARYKGQFDQGWDKLREETLARQKKLGVVPPDTELAPKPAAIKDWDKLTRRRAEALRPPDGGVRRLRRVRRPRGRPAGPGHRGHGPDGQHPHLLHPRRQRRQRRGGHERALQRGDLLQRGRGKRRGHLEALRRAGRPHVIRPLRGGVGRGGGYAVHLDEAGRRELRRHPQRDGRPLARAHQGPRRGALAVASRHRHRADDPGSGRPARAEGRERDSPDPDRRREHGLHVR